MCEEKQGSKENIEKAKELMQELKELELTPEEMDVIAGGVDGKQDRINKIRI